MRVVFLDVSWMPLNTLTQKYNTLGFDRCIYTKKQRTFLADSFFSSVFSTKNFWNDFESSPEKYQENSGRATKVRVHQIDPYVCVARARPPAGNLDFFYKSEKSAIFEIIFIKSKKSAKIPCLPTAKYQRESKSESTFLLRLTEIWGNGETHFQLLHCHSHNTITLHLYENYLVSETIAASWVLHIIAKAWFGTWAEAMERSYSSPSHPGLKCEFIWDFVSVQIKQKI